MQGEVIMPTSTSDDARSARASRARAALEVFPFLLIPVVFYNFVALAAHSDIAAPGAPRILDTIDRAIVALPMLSGVNFYLSWGDLFLLFAIVFLFIEVLKATRTSAPSILNHILSMALFIVCLIEFLLFANFSTATFFLMTMLVLMDALAGMVVTIVSARRDYAVGPN